MRTIGALALLAALASPASAQDPATHTPPPKLKREANLISIAEIESVRDRSDNAMALVRQLRPQFLRARGANSFGNARGGRKVPYPKVIVDGMPRGELDVLNQIPAMTVKEIRFLGSADASVRFGTGYDGGAILVTTR